MPVALRSSRLSVNFRFGPSPCENAKTLDRDRTSYSFNAALAAQIASPFNFEIEPENIILVALRVFEFSHSLGHQPT
jgi:hypothetical protein